MSSPDRIDSSSRKSAPFKARFSRWEIVEPSSDSSHTITSHAPVKIRFHLEVREPIRNAQHGIALFNVDRQLMWGVAQADISFEPGFHHLDYHFPSLPLRPGTYAWQLTIWEHETQVEIWEAMPDLIIAAPNYQHWRDEWNGVLNIPSTFAAFLRKG